MTDDGIGGGRDCVPGLLSVPGFGQGRTHILWDNGNGTASLRRLDAAGGPDLKPEGEPAPYLFGPFAGWTPRAVAAGSDGMVFLLWTGRDRTASVWSVDMEDGDYRHVEFGPYAGWEARALAVGPDAVLRVLWAGADGAAALWSLRPGAPPEAMDYGPFPGWAAASLSVGPDNRAHLLWTRDDGAASVWRVGADGLALQTEYGPHDGWSAVAVAAGRDGTSRLLWKSAGGCASLWTVPAEGESENGLAHSEGQAPFESQAPSEGHAQTLCGPFEGWTPAAVAIDADDAAQLLWRCDGGGPASVWRVDAAGGLTHAEYGPYAGWSPVALASAL